MKSVVSNKQLINILVSSLALVSVASAYADSNSELAKQSQNPIADLISVPIENNANFNAGPDDKVLNVTNIKPVIPMELNAEFNLINRVILPIISQPGVDGTSIDRKNGLGDTTYQGFISPKKPTASGWIWGAGPQVQLPTHTDSRLGNDRVAAGPAFVALKMPGKAVYGTLLSQVWDVTNSGDKRISFLTWQPFYNYNFGGGWYVNTSPVITANFEADGSDQWTVPLGGGIGRVVRLGTQAINFRAAAYGNVVKPKNGPDYNIQLSATLLFPK